jgi:hypothetical protein
MFLFQGPGREKTHGYSCKNVGEQIIATCFCSMDQVQTSSHLVDGIVQTALCFCKAFTKRYKTGHFGAGEKAITPAKPPTRPAEALLSQLMEVLMKATTAASRVGDPDTIQGFHTRALRWFSGLPELVHG